MKSYASFPPSSLDKNPFFYILSKELEKYGWKESTFQFKTFQIIASRRTVSILYFHWPESIWRHKSLIISYIKAINFITKLVVAKTLGYNIVWSVHNVLPHNYRSYHLESLMRRVMLFSTSLIIGHAYNTLNDLVAKFGERNKKKYLLALHGTYETIYSPEGLINREVLKIPGDSKVLFIKFNNHGKGGFDEFVEFWNHQKIQNFHLIATGDIPGNLISNSNTHIFDGYLERTQLADLLDLIDFMILPYKEITTSGLYFLSLTFEKPMVAYNSPFFKSHKNEGITLLYNDINGFEQLLGDIDKGKVSFGDEKDFEEVKSKYSWRNSAKLISSAFNELV